VKPFPKSEFQETYAILTINSGVEILALDHHSQLLVDSFSWRSESGIQAIKSHTRERNEILDNAFAANEVVEIIDMLLKVNV
jgi:hypothetical protein